MHDKKYIRTYSANCIVENNAVWGYDTICRTERIKNFVEVEAGSPAENANGKKLNPSSLKIFKIKLRHFLLLNVLL